MTLISAARGFLAFLLSAPVLQGNGDWRVTYSSSNVCALRGATVDIHCTYDYPDNVQHLLTIVNTLWFTKGDKYQPVDLEHDTDYRGRVESSCGEVSCTGPRCHGTCTLRIKELRQSDSAVYKFMFTTNQPGGKYTGDPGVTLSLTDLQVKVSFLYPTSPTWAELECHSMCGLAGDTPYIWIRNGQNVGQGINYWEYIQSEGSYSCAVEGYEHLTSPLVLLQGNGDWRVTYSSSTVCALIGAMVDINCTYEYPDDVQYRPNTVRTLWFTKGDKYQPVDLEHDADYRGRVEYSCGEVRCTGSRCHGTCTLRIKDLRQSDSSVYKFMFTTNQLGLEYIGNPGVMLSVTDIQVKVSFLYPTDPSYAKLECHSMCGLAGDPPYIWFRNGQNVGQRVNYWAYIQSGESYSCAFEGYERLRSPIVYAPKTPSVTMSPSGEVEEGSSVTLSCSSDANPAANYTWFKEPEIPVKESGQNYTITNITSEHEENYYCQAHNAIGHHNSTSVFIKGATSSSWTTTGVVGTIFVLLATVLLLVFLWMRKKRASRKAYGQGGRPDTVEELLPVYENVSARTNHLAPAAQREPIEEQDDHHSAIIHTSLSENQELPRWLACSRVQSDHTDEGPGPDGDGRNLRVVSAVKSTPQGVNQ
ncbi:unnamed protein product [Arctogadus glacialis]